MFSRVSRLFAKPLFWSVIVNVLALAFVLNVATRGRFDPGMAYSSFVENWLQLVALAVTTVAVGATADAVMGLNRKHDDLHGKVDALRDDAEA